MGGSSRGVDGGGGATGAPQQYHMDHIMGQGGNGGQNAKGEPAPGGKFPGGPGGSTWTMQGGMPGQLGAISNQMSMGFGGSPSSYMNEMNSMYRPMQMPQYSAPGSGGFPPDTSPIPEYFNRGSGMFPGFPPDTSPIPEYQNKDSGMYPYPNNPSPIPEHDMWYKKYPQEGPPVVPNLPKPLPQLTPHQQQGVWTNQGALQQLLAYGNGAGFDGGASFNPPPNLPPHLSGLY